MLLLKFGLFAIAVCLLFPASSVYGHGLGIDTISSVDVQGKKISISVEMPMYFENDQEQITITATEDKTNENAKNVYTEIDTLNIASIKAHERIGFQKISTLKVARVILPVLRWKLLYTNGKSKINYRTVFSVPPACKLS